MAHFFHVFELLLIQLFFFFPILPILEHAIEHKLRKLYKVIFGSRINVNFPFCNCCSNAKYVVSFKLSLENQPLRMIAVDENRIPNTFLNVFHLKSDTIPNKLNASRELPPLSPMCLKWGLPIGLRLKANPAVPAVLCFLLLFLDFCCCYF